MQASVLALFLTVIGSGVWAEPGAGLGDQDEDAAFFLLQSATIRVADQKKRLLKNLDEDAALKSVFLQTKRFFSQDDLAPATMHSHVQLNQHARSAEVVSSKSQEAGEGTTPSLRNHRKPFFWYHLHKSAGTNICQLAQENDEVIPSLTPLSNCNWSPDDHHRWFRMLKQSGRDAPANCSQRLKLWNDTRFTWSQIERPFDLKAMFCPLSFSYATALRDPIQSLESMLSFFDPLEPRNQLERQKDVQCFLRGFTESCPDKLGHAEDSLWIYFDNPIVRLLGGPEIMELPLGGVNSSHSDKVLELLTMFDLVVCVDELDSNATQNRFRTILGWSSTVMGQHSMSSPKTLLLTDADKVVASNMNAHDYKVYNRYCNLSNRVN